jgi:hypothetical protein
VHDATQHQMVPLKIWDDTGTGGKSGSTWCVNSLHCIHVCSSHEAPSVQEDDLFDIKSSRFFLSHEEVAEIEATSTPTSIIGVISSSSVSLSGGLVVSNEAE